LGATPEPDSSGKAEGVIANQRSDIGRFRAPADDVVSILLEERIGCKVAGLPAGGADRRLAFLESIAWTANRMGRIRSPLSRTLSLQPAILGHLVDQIPKVESVELPHPASFVLC
jgi:hypothetical protein